MRNKKRRGTWRRSDGGEVAFEAYVEINAPWIKTGIGLVGFVCMIGIGTSIVLFLSDSEWGSSLMFCTIMLWGLFFGYVDQVRNRLFDEFKNSK